MGVFGKVLGVFGKVLGGVWESRGNFELLLVGRDLAVGRSSRYGRIGRFGRCGCAAYVVSGLRSDGRRGRGPRWVVGAFASDFGN